MRRSLDAERSRDRGQSEEVTHSKEIALARDTEGLELGGGVPDNIIKCLTWRMLEKWGLDKVRLSLEDRGTII